MVSISFYLIIFLIFFIVVAVIYAIYSFNPKQLSMGLVEGTVKGLKRGISSSASKRYKRIPGRYWRNRSVNKVNIYVREVAGIKFGPFKYLATGVVIVALFLFVFLYFVFGVWYLEPLTDFLGAASYFLRSYGSVADAAGRIYLSIWNFVSGDWDGDGEHFEFWKRLFGLIVLEVSFR